MEQKQGPELRVAYGGQGPGGDLAQAQTSFPVLVAVDIIREISMKSLEVGSPHIGQQGAQ